MSKVLIIEGQPRSGAQVVYATSIDGQEGLELYTEGGEPVAAETHGGGAEIAITANRDAALTDANNVLTNSTSNNYTVTILAATAWTQNQIIAKYRSGTGTLTIAAGAGVTFQGTAPTDTQYEHSGLRYRGSNVWAWI